jgi:hypothetical protein
MWGMGLAVRAVALGLGPVLLAAVVLLLVLVLVLVLAVGRVLWAACSLRSAGTMTSWQSQDREGRDLSVRCDSNCPQPLRSRASYQFMLSSRLQFCIYERFSPFNEWHCLEGLALKA